MKIVQTFWSPQRKPVTKNKGGWLCPVINFMSVALSCTLLRRFYDEVELYTTSQYKKLFESLDLPYTKIYASHDNEFMDGLHEDLWAYSKLYTYSLQQKPFLHVDNDIFIWNKFDNEMLSRDVIIQSIEENLQSYKSNIRLLYSIEGAFIPDWVNYTKNRPMAYNCGLFGSNDMSFVKRYCDTAIDFYTKNEKLFKTCKKVKSDFNTLPEQYLLYVLTTILHKSVGMYSNEVLRKSKDFDVYGDIFKCPSEVKFLHTLSSFKKSVYINEFMSFVLKQENSQCWSRIVDYFESNGVYSQFTTNNQHIKHNQYSDNILKRLSSVVRRKNRNNKIAQAIADDLRRVDKMHESHLNSDFRISCPFPSYLEGNRMLDNPLLRNKYVSVNPTLSIIRTKFNLPKIINNDLKLKSQEAYNGLFFSVKFVDYYKFYRYVWMSMGELAIVEMLKKEPTTINKLTENIPKARCAEIEEYIQKLYSAQIIDLVDDSSSVIAQKNSQTYLLYEQNIKKQVQSVLSKFIGMDITFHEGPASYSEVTAYLNKFGISTSAVKCKIENFTRIPLPCISVVNYLEFGNTYVLVTQFKDDKVTLFNPITLDSEIYDMRTFNGMWNGSAIIVRK